MNIVLRPDQFELKLRIYQAWSQGARNVLGVLPTGGGKSVILSDIVQDKFRLGRAGIIKAHRNELVSQLSMHVARRGIPHRIIGPDAMISQIVREHREEFGGRSFVNSSAITTVAGVDTILSRIESLREFGAQQDYWITDEAHHVLRENKWGKCVDIFSNAWGLGVTASPQRADGKGLGADSDGVFHAMELGPDMRALINMGALCEYEIAVPETSFTMDESDISESGDFSQKKMAQKAKQSQIVGDTVQNYIKFASGMRAICFATDVETANNIAQRFCDAGISAVAVSAKTPTEVRNDMIKRFRLGSVTVLVNVDLFGEGFDVPACECVIMARPTASLAVYLQQFGRALRTMPGKLYGLVIDQVENWKRHGYPDKQHIWTLNRREKRSKSKQDDPEAEELKRCTATEPVCGKLYSKFLPSCPHCGFVPIPAARGGPAEVEGDLILLDRETLARMRKATELENPSSVGERVEFAAGPMAAKAQINNQIEKIHAQNRLKDAIAQWAAIQRAKGRSDQESYRRFFHATGVDVLSALSRDNSRADYERLAETVESWWRQ